MEVRYELYFAQGNVNQVALCKIVENILRSAGLHGSIFESAIVLDEEDSFDIVDGAKVALGYVPEETTISNIIKRIKSSLAIDKVYVRKIEKVVENW